ncbi:matrix-remodeling-associated protein 7-like isoform X1 [Lates japonicus]|uniref:Matrix-remodeling-associated protein 7-like isoform X1 n=1 Tax=Lates japonicus TaxID=270547 RepID=A0AAD3NDF1_LATJO|nr:matrix-remodeling-associated protein 7-like isoform X1 [Lates japonicus]
MRCSAVVTWCGRVAVLSAEALFGARPSAAVAGLKRNSEGRAAKISTELHKHGCCIISCIFTLLAIVVDVILFNGSPSTNLANAGYFGHRVDGAAGGLEVGAEAERGHVPREEEGGGRLVWISGAHDHWMW